MPINTMAVLALSIAVSAPPAPAQADHKSVRPEAGREHQCRPPEVQSRCCDQQPTTTIGV